MEPRIFHGKITPRDIANTLAAEFNQGNLRTNKFGSEDRMMIQITTTNQPTSGGRTAITVIAEKIPDGVAIQVGQHSWMGVAASLGQTALWAWLNPWNLINRLDDLAQDIEHLSLDERIWNVIEAFARTAGATTDLAERLNRMVCEYCSTANPSGEGRCIGCGAPLGNVLPASCKNCGYVLRQAEKICPNCGKTV
jgi:hypothetical protein